MSRCHRCNYDLTGLPEDHRCPECGLAYGALTYVRRPAEPWWPIIGAGLVAYMVFSLSMPILIEFVGVPVRVATGMAWAGIVGFIVWRVRNLRRGVKLVVCGDGVLVRDMRHDLFLPWDEIDALEVVENARVFSTMSTVKLVLRDGRRLSLDHFFLRRAEVSAFQRAYQAAKASSMTAAREVR